ncbi:MAG: hypothetical protein IJF16_08220 [Clostridia bacterium]|nr:hypothetical protein [Clostridia bacterium]
MNLKKCLHRFLLALKKLCICLFLAVLLVNVYVIGARAYLGDPLPTVFGYSWAVIGSGSMEPAIKVNDMVIIKNRTIPKRYVIDASALSGAELIDEKFNAITSDTVFMTGMDVSLVLLENSDSDLPESIRVLIGENVYEVSGDGSESEGGITYDMHSGDLFIPSGIIDGSDIVIMNADAAPEASQPEPTPIPTEAPTAAPEQTLAPVVEPTSSPVAEPTPTPEVDPEPTPVVEPELTQAP